MDTLLLYFALPIAIIILSIVLQKILRCPILVGATFFAILLIVAFTAFDSSFLIFVIIYTILSYVTAVLTRLICNLLEKFADCFNNGEKCICGNNRSRNDNNMNGRNTICCSNNSCNSSCNSNENNMNNTNSINNGQRSCFTLTSNQSEPVLFLTSKSNNPNCNNWNIRNGNYNTNNCCCRRR